MNFRRNRFGKFEMQSIKSGMRNFVHLYTQGNEIFTTTKCGEFLDKLSFI